MNASEKAIAVYNAFYAGLAFACTRNQGSSDAFSYEICVTGRGKKTRVNFSPNNESFITIDEPSVYLGLANLDED